MAPDPDNQTPLPGQGASAPDTLKLPLPPESEEERTQPPDALVGQLIGEYRVLRRIGSGGMGVVYEGEHPVIGRKVALKVIRQDSSHEARSRDLAAEARAVSTIRHRGIIDVFGFGHLPGVGPYLVMELLDGRPLDALLQARAPLPLAQALWIISEVFRALSAAHAQGVIHRDLKPGNIFLVRETTGAEYVKVLDFGLAKQAPSPHGATPQTRTSIIIGTPEYMAPEQACGQPVSPRTDLYAAGVILFELLTGRLPFQGTSAMHIAIQQVHSAPPAPSSFAPGLAPELDELVLRLLAKDADARPSSGDAVVQELALLAGKLLPGEPGTASLALAASQTLAPVVWRPAGAPSCAPLEGPQGISPTLISALRVESAPLPVPEETAKTLEVTPAVVRRRPQARLAVGLGLLGVGFAVGMVWVKPQPPTRVSVTPIEVRPAAPAPTPALEPARAVEPSSVPALPAEPSLPTEPVPPPEAGAANRLQDLTPGTLRFVSLCWADLYVDGTLRGRMPQKKLLILSPGVHRVELRNNTAITNPRKTLVIRPGAENTYNVDCPDDD